MMRLPQRASSVTAYCALFALAVLQLGIALHHDQHSATDLTNSCVACLQLEQFDDMATANAVDLVIAPDDAIGVAPATPTPDSGLLRRYYGRAPPARS